MNPNVTAAEGYLSCRREDVYDSGTGDCVWCICQRGVWLDLLVVESTMKISLGKHCFPRDIFYIKTELFKIAVNISSSGHPHCVEIPQNT